MGGGGTVVFVFFMFCFSMIFCNKIFLYKKKAFEVLIDSVINEDICENGIASKIELNSPALELFE